MSVILTTVNAWLEKEQRYRVIEFFTNTLVETKQGLIYYEK